VYSPHLGRVVGVAHEQRELLDVDGLAQTAVHQQVAARAAIDSSAPHCPRHGVSTIAEADVHDPQTHALLREPLGRPHSRGIGIGTGGHETSRIEAHRLS
jgi:hypothetical protein